MYRANCWDCNDFYIGKTKRRLRDRNQFGLVIQSNKNVLLDDASFKIEGIHVHLPKGGGYSTRYLLNSYGRKFERVLMNTRSLYNVPRNLVPFCGVVAFILGLRLANGESLPHFKALTTNCHESAIADHVFSTNHRIKWDHFEILATGRSDMHCKIKESLLIRDLKPALNENVGSEKLYLYY